MHYRVELDRGYLERMRTSPRKAISELIWNAVDADAETVAVSLFENALGGTDRISVTDDGHGMTVEEAAASFGRLGGSWKASAAGSRSKGRSLHGREGGGRFFAARLAGHTRWESVTSGSDGQRSLVIVDVMAGALDDVQITDGGRTERPRGTTVILRDFGTPPPVGDRDAAVDRLVAEFGVYLTKYPVDLTYDGVVIDPSLLQAGVKTYRLPGIEGIAELDVVEWTKDLGRKLFLCDAAGTALTEVHAGVQAPGMHFTAYLRWDGFAADEALDLAELATGVTADAVEAARTRLREHVRARAAERRQEIIASWKADAIYPYSGEPADQVERTSRQLFDVVAFTARDAIGGDQRAKRFSLALLREALERDPGHLRRVLDEVLDLDEGRLADLSRLLDRTTLAALVAAGRSITDRLDFLRALEEMVFEPEVRKRTLERSQLHRMLASETWVFGEEFNLLADDESLTNVLRRHLAVLGRDELAAEPVTDEHGRTRIVDLMLGKTAETSQNRREHLVVELKAPSVSVGHKEVAQIRDYAAAIAEDSQFDMETTTWDFWVVSTDMTDAVKRQVSQRNRAAGILDDYGDLPIRIWAKTWGQVIGDARHRLKFVRSQLDYTSGRAEAVAYLHEKHRDVMPVPLREDQDSGG